MAFHAPITTRSWDARPLSINSIDYELADNASCDLACALGMLELITQHGEESDISHAELNAIYGAIMLLQRAKAYGDAFHSEVLRVRGAH